MAENEFSLYELLDKMRAKPKLYLGVLSLTRLYHFVEGYRFALLNHGFKEVTEPSFRDFHSWTRARLGQDRSTQGWAGSILEACDGDEAQAVGHFYEMLDEYRSNQFPGLVKQWEAEWDAISKDPVSAGPQDNVMQEPLSQEVWDRIAAEYPDAAHAEVAQALLGYRVVPINFGRLRILEAARGHAADLRRLVEAGNRYGQEWIMDYDGGQ